MGFIIRDGVLVWYKEEEGAAEVTIPAGVTEIGEDTFYGCKIAIT